MTPANIAPANRPLEMEIPIGKEGSQLGACFPTTRPRNTASPLEAVWAYTSIDGFRQALRLKPQTDQVAIEGGPWGFWRARVGWNNPYKVGPY